MNYILKFQYNLWFVLLFESYGLETESRQPGENFRRDRKRRQPFYETHRHTQEPISFKIFPNNKMGENQTTVNGVVMLIQSFP